MDDTDVATAILAEGSVLDEDTIPNQNQSLKCFSCGETVRGLYCVHCGQKNDDYRRSILRLVGEFIGSFTAIESRIWRTWATLLFKPGKVAREFADGARMKWSSPVRVFLTISILLFGFLTLTQTQLVSIDINVLPKKGITKPHSELTAHDLRIKGGVKFFETKKQIDARNKTRNFDLIDKWIRSGVIINFNSNDDKITPKTSIENPNKPSIKSDKNDKTEAKNAIKVDELNRNLADVKQQAHSKLSPEEKLKLKISQRNKSLDDILKDRALSVIRNPMPVNAIIYKWLPRIMFLMMPITMFIAIIFIRGRGNALLYDHLVHAAYIHSVAFFLLFIGILLMRFFPGVWIAKILVVIMLIYLPLSLKRMFGRGWIKTIWASYSVGFIYVFSFIFILLAITSWRMKELVTNLT